MLSARDLVRQIPAEWQENVKHRRTMTYADFLDEPPRPEPQHRGRRSGSGASRRCPTCSTAGASRCRASGCTWSRCPARARARPAVGAVRRAVRHRPDRVRPRPTGPTPRSAYPSRRWCGGSTSGSTTCSPTTTTGAFVRETARAPQPLGRARLTPARAARRRRTAGRATSPQSWVERARAARVRRGRRPRRPAARRRPAPFVDPDRPDEAAVADAALDALGDHDRARRPGCATWRSSCTASSPTCTGELERFRGTRTLPGQGAARRACPRPTPSPRGRAGGLPAAAGQQLAVDVAADLPGREPVGAGADQPADDRHPAADGGRDPLAGDLGEQLGRRPRWPSRVEVRVVHRRGGQRHRRAGQLLLPDQRRASAPRRAGRPGSRCGCAGRRGRSRAGARSPATIRHWISASPVMLAGTVTAIVTSPPMLVTKPWAPA